MRRTILILVLTIGVVSLTAFLTLKNSSEPKGLIENSSQFNEAGRPSFGIYEVCSDIENCSPEAGIEKIRAAGISSVVITVLDEEEEGSRAYYPSQYLAMLDSIPQNYLKRVIESAHKDGIKVYGSINLPHKYWLSSHPDWIAVYSNGKDADSYEQDYFHQIVPPSRIISEKEYIDLLKNIIKEVLSYGFDGIDINDNFQFPDQYLEENDEIIFSSFDDFTIRKFEKEKGIDVKGESVKEKARYIKANVYTDWMDWRAQQVTNLIKSLKGDFVLRPHLLTFKDPYEYYGIDYDRISEEVDVLYLMITPEQPREKYFEVISDRNKRVAVSTYLFKEEDWSAVEEDRNKILERIKWIKEAGAEEIYFYNFELVEKGNLWEFIKNII